MKRKLFKLADGLSLVLVVWLLAAIIPLGWFWYVPGQVVVSNSSLEVPPRIQFERVIKRPVLMKYQVVVRDIERNEVVCDPASEPFTYSPTSKLPENADLVWWTGGDARCWPRVAGTYVMETCWTATHVVWGLVPDKTVCRTSNTFEIRAINPKAAIEQIERLEREVQELKGESHEAGN